MRGRSQSWLLAAACLVVINAAMAVLGATRGDNWVTIVSLLGCAAAGVGIYDA